MVLAKGNAESNKPLLLFVRFMSLHAFLGKEPPPSHLFSFIMVFSYYGFLRSCAGCDLRLF